MNQGKFCAQFCEHQTGIQQSVKELLGFLRDHLHSSSYGLNHLIGYLTPCGVQEQVGLYVGENITLSRGVDNYPILQIKWLDNTILVV